MQQRPAKRPGNRTAPRPVTHAVQRLAQQLAEVAAGQRLELPGSTAGEPRPGPSRPALALPDPARPSTWNLRTTTTATSLLLESEPSRARSWCWACDGQRDFQDCAYCGAPDWEGTVVRHHATDGKGVYVLASDAGLVKVGMSRTLTERVDFLIRQAARAGHDCWLWACLPGASGRVERWLHEAFVQTCDRRWAEAEGLPNPTEWFWPTPGLRALVDGLDFVDRIAPEQEAA
jgi:hypothetical protein